MKTLEIKVTTIPNGYELEVNKHQYIYFSLPKLMMGISQHCQNKIDAENCEYFAQALADDIAPTDHFRLEVKNLNAQIKDARRTEKKVLKEMHEWKTLYDSKNSECKEAQKQVRALSRELAKVKEQLKAKASSNE